MRIEADWASENAKRREVGQVFASKFECPCSVRTNRESRMTTKVECVLSREVLAQSELVLMGFGRPGEAAREGSLRRAFLSWHLLTRPPSRCPHARLAAQHGHLHSTPKRGRQRPGCRPRAGAGHSPRCCTSAVQRLRFVVGSASAAPAAQKFCCRRICALLRARHGAVRGGHSDGVVAPHRGGRHGHSHS